MFLGTEEMQQYVRVYEHMGIEQMAHTNHSDCPAGEDRKRRLYIRRVDDGVLFFCHHCGSKGYLKLRSTVHRASDIAPTKDHLDGVAPSALLMYLDDGHYICPMSVWSKEARLWWMSYGLDENDADGYGTSWDGRRLWLNGGDVWQGRAFGKDHPKYLTLSAPNPAPSLFISMGAAPVIVVEDLLSAYKVHKAGYNALALRGTKIRDNDLTCLITYATMGVVVWLDDDEAGQVDALKVHRTIRSVISPVKNICYKQPKELSLDEIRRSVEYA